MLDVDKMRLRRLELRLSQKALGEAIRQDQAYISRVENGIITDVTAETLGRIARVLEVPMEQLLILDAAEAEAPQGKQPRPRRKSAAKPKTPAPKRTRTPAKAAKS